MCNKPHAMLLCHIRIEVFLCEAQIHSYTPTQTQNCFCEQIDTKILCNNIFCPAKLFLNTY